MPKLSAAMIQQCRSASWVYAHYCRLITAASAILFPH